MCRHAAPMRRNVRFCNLTTTQFFGALVRFRKINQRGLAMSNESKQAAPPHVRTRWRNLTAETDQAARNLISQQRIQEQAKMARLRAARLERDNALNLKAPVADEGRRS